MGFYVQIRDVMNREYGRIFAGETSVDDGFAVIRGRGQQASRPLRADHELRAFQGFRRGGVLRRPPSW